MTLYNTLADDFYINLNLNTEMQLPTARDTVLDFFGRVQKTYPSMRNFYTRENGDFVLEEDKDQGHQRWVSLEPRRVCSGYVNPPDMDSAFGQHDLVLQLVPFMLSVSPLDCEALDSYTDIRELQAGLEELGVEMTVRADPDGAGPASFVIEDPDGNPILIDQHV